MVIKFLPWYRIAVSCLPASTLTIQFDYSMPFSLCVSDKCVFIIQSKSQSILLKNYVPLPYAHIDMYIHIQVDIYMCMLTCPFLL